MADKQVKQSTSIDAYPGEWVALVNHDRVVEHARTLEELDKKVRQKSFEEEPAYFLVPRDDEGPYILIVHP